MRYLMMVAVVMVLVKSALAVPTGLTNSEYVLPGVSAAAQPNLAGTVIKDVVLPYSIHKNVNDQPSETIVNHGTVQVRDVKTHDGTLTFYWKVNNAADSKTSLSQVEVGFMPVHSYDVNWRPDGLGTAAPDKVRIVTVPNSVGLYRFEFDNQPIAPGKSSRFFFIRTTATKMGKTSIAPMMKNQSDYTNSVLGAAPEF